MFRCLLKAIAILLFGCHLRVFNIQFWFVLLTFKDVQCLFFYCHFRIRPQIDFLMTFKDVKCFVICCNFSIGSHFDLCCWHLKIFNVCFFHFRVRPHFFVLSGTSWRVPNRWPAGRTESGPDLCRSAKVNHIQRYILRLLIVELLSLLILIFT